MYIVYYIKYKGKIIYIGRTDNIIRREKQHNYNLKKGETNKIYGYLRYLGVENIKLIKVKSFNNIVDSKRYECLLILQRYFKVLTMYQKIPTIRDL